MTLRQFFAIAACGIGIPLVGFVAERLSSVI